MPIEDFWRSMKGLMMRLADIAHNFTWSTLNTSIKESVAVYVPAVEEKRIITWRHMGDDKVCGICTINAGDYDVSDPFLPDMPSHVNCRCVWEIKVTVER